MLCITGCIVGLLAPTSKQTHGAFITTLECLKNKDALGTFQFHSDPSIIVPVVLHGPLLVDNYVYLCIGTRYRHRWMSLSIFIKDPIPFHKLSVCIVITVLKWS